MLAAVREPDSMTSGYSVPCARNLAPVVLARDLLEHADELLADHLALLLGVGDAGELREEPVRRLHVDRAATPKWRRERLLDLVGLALAEEPVVDEHAGELVADGPVHEQRGDRRVHAAGERAQHLGVADLRPDGLDAASMTFVGVQSGSRPHAS